MSDLLSDQGNVVGIAEGFFGEVQVIFPSESVHDGATVSSPVEVTVPGVEEPLVLFPVRLKVFALVNELSYNRRNSIPLRRLVTIPLNPREPILTLPVSKPQRDVFDGPRILANPKSLGVPAVNFPVRRVVKVADNIGLVLVHGVSLFIVEWRTLATATINLSSAFLSESIFFDSVAISRTTAVTSADSAREFTRTSM